MNDAPNLSPDPTSIPDPAQLAQWHDEAAQATAEPDLRERVRDLTARALHDRRMALNEVRDIVGAITSGIGSGLSARGGEMKDGLRQAVSGLDEAVGSAAQVASLTLREAVSKGKAYKDNELKDSLEQLRDLESQLIDTVRQTARQTGGKLKEEFDALGEHMRVSGTRTGEQVQDALRQMASGIKTSSQAGRAGLSESADVAVDRLSKVASGVLAALSDSLKRQSDRLRS